MATRPTLDDFVGYRRSGVPVPGSADEDILQLCLDASLEMCEEGIDVPDDATAYPSRLRLAVLIYASKLAKRNLTPEGVAAFGEFGVIRIVSVDADVTALLQRLKRLDNFA